jgi:hypothetical protein
MYPHDYKLIMVGTPPRIRGTYGEKVWKEAVEEAKIPHFFWTVHQNPYVLDVDGFIRETCTEKGLDISHPYIRREYFGEWVYDEDALLYPEYHTWNEGMVPKLGEVDQILVGIDYGASDNDAIIGTAWNKASRRGFVFYEEKFNRLTCPKSMTQFEYLKACCRELWETALDFWPEVDRAEANKRITWEADSSDGQLTEELQVNCKCRYPELSMYIGVAHKHDKILMEDKIRDLLRTAALLVPEKGVIASECQMTVLKRDSKGNLKLDIDDKAYHPDGLPALRYSLWPVLGSEILALRTKGDDGFRDETERDIEDIDIYNQEGFNYE